MKPTTRPLQTLEKQGYPENKQMQVEYEIVWIINELRVYSNLMVEISITE